MRGCVLETDAYKQELSDGFLDHCLTRPMVRSRLRANVRAAKLHAQRLDFAQGRPYQRCGISTRRAYFLRYPYNGIALHVR